MTLGTITPIRTYTQLTTGMTYHTPPESRPNTGHNQMPVTGLENTSGGVTTPIDPLLQSPLRPVENSQIHPISSLSTSVEDEHEIAFLMRHYAEVPGYGYVSITPLTVSPSCFGN